MVHKLLLADECDLILIGTQTILKTHPEWEVIEPVRNAKQLLDVAHSHQPKVVLFNQHLDSMVDVLALVERLKHIAPHSRQIVLGNKIDGLLVRDLFACGVVSYLFCGDNLAECLIPALNAAKGKDLYLSPSANAAYLTAMKSPERDWKLNSEARAVLRLLARGLHISEIATQMDVPLRRIYWVRQKLRKRFGANTNEHLLSIAIAEGFAYAD